MGDRGKELCTCGDIRNEHRLGVGRCIVCECQIFHSQGEMMDKDYNGHKPELHLVKEAKELNDIFPGEDGVIRNLDVSSKFPDIDLSDPDEFLQKAKRIAVDEYNKHLPAGIPDKLTIGDVFIVWFSKTLQNWKALVATNVVGDGLYFEVTYNGDRLEAYVDTYIKIQNTVVSDDIIPIRRKA